VSRPIRLHPTGQDGQFRDDAGRLWVANDASKPGSNPPEESRCGVCGVPRGVVTYARDGGGYAQPGLPGVAACDACVEIAPDPAAAAVAREARRREHDASEGR
jgi:hypothetical protein